MFILKPHDVYFKKNWLFQMVRCPHPLYGSLWSVNNPSKADMYLCSTTTLYSMPFLFVKLIFMLFKQKSHILKVITQVRKSLEYAKFLPISVPCKHGLNKNNRKSFFTFVNLSSSKIPHFQCTLSLLKYKVKLTRCFLCLYCNCPHRI